MAIIGHPIPKEQTFIQIMKTTGFKTFCVWLAILVYALYPAWKDDEPPPDKQKHIPPPKEGEWVLGYDYQKKEYIYGTEELKKWENQKNQPWDTIREEYIEFYYDNQITDIDIEDLLDYIGD
jgi:hypothetical protein